MDIYLHTVSDGSIFVSLLVLVVVNGLFRVAVFGMDCDVEGGDIDWSIWFEWIFDGDDGDVTPLGFVADDERWRVKKLVPVGWDVLTNAARVAIEGVEGDATKYSLLFKN